MHIGTLASALLAAIAVPSPAPQLHAPLVVYGADSGGTGAAIAAARLGCRTILIGEHEWLGGMMTSGGIGVFDGSPIGHSLGLSCGIFGDMKQRLANLYPQHGGYIGNAYCYEPKIGARVLDDMAAELPNLRIIRNTRLVGVEVRGNRVTALHVKGAFTGTVRGDVFIDGTDTGLLAARAGVPYRLGTDDSNHLVMAYSVRSTFMRGPEALVPFPKDPATGEEIPPPYYSSNYGECVREVEWRWEYWQNAGSAAVAPGVFNPYGRLPILDAELRKNHVKWDINGDANDITLDHIAEQLVDDPEVGFYFRDEAGRPIPARACIPAVEDDPTLDEGMRELVISKIVRCVRSRSLAVLYYIRNSMRELGGQQWGLARDYDTEDGLPPKIYQREGRRIVGQFTLTEYDQCPTFDADYKPGMKRGACSSVARRFDDAIAIGDYAIDFHRIDRTTGNVWFVLKPYQVPYRIMVPVNRENLLVTTAVSATHGAYGSLRVDPLRMLCGQACGTAACVALRTRPARTDEVDVRAVQDLLIGQRVMLTYLADVPFDPISGGGTLGDLFIPTQVLAIRGVLTGYADFTFRRHELIPREQFAKLLTAAAGWAPATPDVLPADVPESHWAFEHICTALAHGAMALDEQRRFRPLDETTRMEGAIAVAVAANLPVPEPSRSSYDDVPHGHPAWPATEALLAPCPEDGKPIYAGVAPRVFAPDAPLTRAHAAVLVQRALLPLVPPELARGRSWRP